LTCAELREELEAYALGALDIQTARAVGAHISECRECAALARAYQDAASYLSLSVPLYRASPRLKQRVMGGIGSWRSAAIALPMQGWWTRVAAVLMVALLIGAAAWVVMLTSEVSNLRRDNDRLAELTQLDQQQRQALFTQLNSAKNEQIVMSSTLEEYATLLVVALDPDLIPSNLAGTNLASGATCNYVWSGSQNVGALTCKGLPNTGFSLTYELWANKGNQMVALGSFQPGTDGTAQMLVKFPQNTPDGPIGGYWVTLEQQGSNRSAPSQHVILQPAPSLQAAR
jgi:anti-sigma-K factor RskA